MKHFTLYADGSSLGNGQPGARGGWAFVCRPKDDDLNTSQWSGNLKGATNNQMELTAVIEAFKFIGTEPAFVEVVTDSKYVVKGASEWIKGWLRKNWKDVKNIDLWKQLIEHAKPHRIKWTWVKGHAGHKYNELCDQLAVGAARKL